MVFKGHKAEVRSRFVDSEQRPEVSCSRAATTRTKPSHRGSDYLLPRVRHPSRQPPSPPCRDLYKDARVLSFCDRLTPDEVADETTDGPFFLSPTIAVLRTGTTHYPGAMRRLAGSAAPPQPPRHLAHEREKKARRRDSKPFRCATLRRRAPESPRDQTPLSSRRARTGDEPVSPRIARPLRSPMSGAAPTVACWRQPPPTAT